MKFFYEISIISIIFFSICFVYKGQQRITLNGGKGWDGIYYYKITEQIQAGTRLVVGELPFIKRLGTPFLISVYSNITGTNILDSALYINLTGVFITVILLLFWLKLFINEFWIRGLLCFLFMMAWYAPLRYSFYIPLTSDAWGAVWFVGGLLLLHIIRESYTNKNNKAFIAYIFVYSLVIAIGTFFRESNGVLCILPFFILNPFKNLKFSSGRINISNCIYLLKKTLHTYLNRQTIFLFVPLIFIALTNILIGTLIKVDDRDGYSYFQNVLLCLFTKTLPEYLLGILIAFGPVLMIVPFFYSQFKSLLWENQELGALLIISLLFGLIGGTDTERILFMSGFPVILLLLGISMKGIFNSPQRWWLYVLLILQTISFRFFWSLPDHTIKSGHTPIPFFGLMSDHVKYLYLYSHFSNNILSLLLLIEYFILFVATWYVLHNKVALKRFPPGQGNNMDIIT
jgi:hypothetical protein